MRSLKARFNGQAEKVVQYARQFGIMATMDEYQVKDYAAMHNFLKAIAPNENFQAAKTDVSAYAGPDAFDRLLEAMLRKYSELQSKISALVIENAELKKQIKKYRAIKWQSTRPVVQKVMDYCEDNG